jgi:hypothetical protein
VVKVKYLVIAMVVTIAAVITAIYLLHGEEYRIRRRFALLAKWATKAEKESNLTLVQKTRSISSLCVRPCHIKTPKNSFSGTYSPQQISSLIARARMPFSRLAVEFDDLHIELAGKERATVRTTAQVKGTLKRGERIDDIHEIECGLQKLEGKWLFTRFELIEVLER